jgi:hypothetical protein
MQRRSFLRRVLAGSTITFIGVAGCTAAPGGTVSPEPTERTAEPTDSGPHPVTPTATAFNIQDRSCGEGANDATILVDGSMVRVNGVIGGSDTCDTARLLEVDLHDGVLTVVIATVKEETSETPACGQCLTDIEYAFETTVLESVPETIKVVHESSGGREVVAEKTATE